MYGLNGGKLRMNHYDASKMLENLFQHFKLHFFADSHIKVEVMKNISGYFKFCLFENVLVYGQM